MVTQEQELPTPGEGQVQVESEVIEETPEDLEAIRKERDEYKAKDQTNEREIHRLRSIAGQVRVQGERDQVLNTVARTMRRVDSRLGLLEERADNPDGDPQEFKQQRQRVLQDEDAVVERERQERRGTALLERIEARGQKLEVNPAADARFSKARALWEQGVKKGDLGTLEEAASMFTDEFDDVATERAGETRKEHAREEVDKKREAGEIRVPRTPEGGGGGGDFAQRRDAYINDPSNPRVAEAYLKARRERGL